jgi:hypothetical protein
MHELYDAEGGLVASVPLSPMLLEQVEAGETVEIRFHMPKMLRALGRLHVDGTFSVAKVGERYVTDDPASASAYAEIQDAARRQQPAELAAARPS